MGVLSFVYVESPLKIDIEDKALMDLSDCVESAKRVVSECKDEDLKALFISFGFKE